MRLWSIWCHRKKFRKIEILTEAPENKKLKKRVWPGYAFFSLSLYSIAPALTPYSQIHSCPPSKTRQDAVQQSRSTPKQSPYGSSTTLSQYPTQSPHGSRSCSTTLRPLPPLSVIVRPRESDQYLTKTLQYYSQSDQWLTGVANKCWQYRTNLYNSLIVVIH